LINNRQGGRRRGRGGGGGGRVPNNAPSGNRQDNRQRGNAAQLLEKYKQLARDAQMQGDRVQSEYYLQFAEHYFRLLNENRARFEDQRRGREDEYSDEDEGEDEMAAADGDDGQQEEEQPRRRDGYREQREAAREQREPRETREQREPREPRPPRGEGEYRNGEARHEGRGRRSRRDMNGDAPGRGSEADESRISLDILPPAIGASPAPVEADEGDGDPPRPRRRARRPRGDEAGEIAPAAA